MQLPTDPFILLSVVNMRLRDEGIDLEEFCKQYDVDRSQLEQKLGEAGFRYNAQANAFR